jgi:hypothetical protein
MTAGLPLGDGLAVALLDLFGVVGPAEVDRLAVQNGVCLPGGLVGA